MPEPIFAYLGPETLLPVASVGATVAGLVLMFGKNVYRLLVWGCRSLLSRPGHRTLPARPHLQFVKETSQDASRR